MLPDASFIPLSIALDGDAPAAGRRLRIRAAAHEDKGAGGPSTSATPTEALVVRDLPFTWRPPAVVLRALMSAFGPVAGVAVDPVDARSAVVLFEGGGGGGGGGVEAALAAARAGRVVGVGVGLPRVEGPVGLKAWVEGHRAHFPGTDALQAEVKCGPPFAGWGGVGWGGVGLTWREDEAFPPLTSHLYFPSAQIDAWMAAFDGEHARKAAAATVAAAAADDGWTVVVRGGGGRKKTVGPGGVTVGAVAPAAAAARAAAAKPLKVDTDFYRFQRRDARRNGTRALKI